MSPEVAKETELSPMAMEREVAHEPPVERIYTNVSYESEKSVDQDRLDIHNKRAAKPDDSDGKIVWSPRRIGAAVALTGLYTASQLPATFIGGALSFVAADVGSENELWFLTSNQLGLCAFAPFTGYLTDLLGRRYITLAGGLMLIMGCVVVGTAHSSGQVITGMTFAGAAAAICELNALAGVAEITPVRLRGFYLALVVGCILPMSPYILYDQWLGRNSTWRWTMWITVIVTGVSWVGTACLYFPPPRHRVDGLTRRETAKRIDWTGGLSSICGLSLLLVGLGNGGNSFPWKSGAVIAPIIIGVLLLIFFVVWEAIYVQHPMVPGALFKDRRPVTISLIIIFVCGLFFISMLGFFPLVLTVLYPNLSPTQAGVRGVGFGAGVTLGASVGSVIISYSRGHVRELFVISCAAMTAFTAAMIATTPDNPNYAAVVGSMAGFSIGGAVSPTITVAVTCCPDSIVATAVGLCLATRAVGGALGSTIYGTVLNNRIVVELPKSVAAYALAAGLPVDSVKEFVEVFLTNPTNITSVPGATAHIIAQAELGVPWGYAHALKYVWYSSIPFGILATVASAFLPNIKSYLTNRVAVDYH